jgi:hypothetical protein
MVLLALRRPFFAGQAADGALTSISPLRKSSASVLCWCRCSHLTVTPLHCERPTSPVGTSSSFRFPR